MMYIPITLTLGALLLLATNYSMRTTLRASRYCKERLSNY